jgi:hypothetical protein
MKLFVTQPNGKLYETAHSIGVKDHESQYFRIMTEKWGKLFFYSKEDYDRWCRTGRRDNERTNTLFVADHKDQQYNVEELQELEGHAEYMECEELSVLQTENVPLN